MYPRAIRALQPTRVHSVRANRIGSLLIDSKQFNTCRAADLSIRSGAVLGYANPTLIEEMID